MISNHSLLIITLIYFISLLIKNAYAVDSYLTTYGDCNSVPGTEEENKTFCNTIFNSDLCQNYYNNPEQAVGAECDELDIATVNYHKEKGKAVCQYDENNKLCPIGQYYIDVTNNSNANEDDYMKQSCESNICAETAKSYLLAKEKFYSLKYPNKMDRFSVKFEEEKKILECSTTNEADSKKSTSGTNSNSSTDNKSNADSSNTGSSNADSSNTDSVDNNSSGSTVDTNSNNNNGNTAESLNQTASNIEINSGESLFIDKKLIFLVSFILVNIFFL